MNLTNVITSCNSLVNPCNSLVNPRPGDILKFVPNMQQTVVILGAFLTGMLVHSIINSYLDNSSSIEVEKTNIDKTDIDELNTEKANIEEPNEEKSKNAAIGIQKKYIFFPITSEEKQHPITCKIFIHLPCLFGYKQYEIELTNSLAQRYIDWLTTPTFYSCF